MLTRLPQSIEETVSLLIQELGPLTFTDWTGLQNLLAARIINQSYDLGHCSNNVMGALRDESSALAEESMADITNGFREIARQATLLYAQLITTRLYRQLYLGASAFSIEDEQGNPKVKFPDGTDGKKSIIVQAFIAGNPIDSILESARFYNDLLTQERSAKERGADPTKILDLAEAEIQGFTPEEAEAAIKSQSEQFYDRIVERFAVVGRAREDKDSTLPMPSDSTIIQVVLENIPDPDPELEPFLRDIAERPGQATGMHPAFRGLTVPNA